MNHFDHKLSYYEPGLQALGNSIHRTKPDSQKRIATISLSLNTILGLMDIFRDDNFALTHLLFVARTFHSLAFEVPCDNRN